MQKEVLDLIQNNSQSLTIQEIADKIDKSQDIEAIYKILRHLSANNRGIHLEGDRISPSNLQVKYMK